MLPFATDFSRLFLLLLLPGLCPWLATIQAQDTLGKVYIVLGDERQEIFSSDVWLEQTIEVFRDTTGDLSFGQVSVHPEWFAPNQTRGNFDPRAVYWMKLRLEADSLFRDSLQLFVERDEGYRSWRQVDAWLVHEDGRVETQHTGAAFLPEDKTIPSLRSLVAYGLERSEKAQLYVRVANGVPLYRPPSFLGLGANRAAEISRYSSSTGYQFSGGYPISHDYTPYRYAHVPLLALLQTSDASLDLPQLSAQGSEIPWENPLNFVPREGNVYWLKTRLIGSASFQGEHIFLVSPDGHDVSSYEYIDVYLSHNGGDFAHQRTGLAVPSEERPYDFWATFFKVDLQPGDTVDLYLRLQGANRYSSVPELRLLHIDPVSVFEPQVQEARIIMFILGAVAMQFAFFFCLFLIERERIHFFFSLFILGCFLVMATNWDFTMHFFPFAGWLRYFLEINTIGAIFMMIGSLKFTETYFNYSSGSLWVRRIIPALLTVEVILFLGVLITRSQPGMALGYLLYQIFLAIALLHVVVLLVLGIVADRQTKALKVVFLLGIVPSLIALGGETLDAVVLFLNGRESLSSYSWMESFPFTILFLLTVFSLSIGYRRNMLKRDKEAAMQASLEAQKTVIAQLEETARLERMDEVKTRFYANITHEFRTPLTVILGMVDQIRGHGQERELIRRNSQNLLHLINQMLDLSKLESGKLQLTLVQGDIIPFLEYLTESFFSMAREKDIRLLFYPEVEGLVMDYDEAKVQHIVYNLLSNALKFTPEGGKIVLHAALEEADDQRWLRLKVQDSGIGIAEDQVDQVFDRFYQADASTTRQGEGTGIGLSLTRELVKLMEGDISVQSQLGQGSTFTVRLPVRQTADLPAPQGLPVETSVPTSKVSIPSLPSTEATDDKPVLVLIEDNADVATYITGLLQAQYEIHVERNGQAGLDRVLEMIPDIVISDVMMPVMDGFEVCERLKQDERSSHIPIILLTARGTQEDRLTGLRGGADAYLTKPFEKEELFIRLEKLRELRQALKARYAGGGAVFQEIARQKTTDNPDDAFLQKLIRAVHDRLDDPQLGVNDLCRAARLSNAQVNRKLKALLGKTPSQFIRLIRLQRALELLQSSEQNVSEVAYAVGFSAPNYFSRAFSEEFGYPPSEVRR